MAHPVDMLAEQTNQDDDWCSVHYQNRPAGGETRLKQKDEPISISPHFLQHQSKEGSTSTRLGTVFVN
jgi:hypothetical protein